MKHLVEWQNDTENAAPEERATVADLRLSIQDINVTEHLFGDVLNDHVTVAIYGLAHGITHNWWTIFGSRDQDISLLNYRSGYVLPDIRIRFDGAAFEVEARQRLFRNPAVRFWEGPSEVMSREAGETMLTDLVQTVLDRLDAEGQTETSAALRWKRVQASRTSPDAAFCEAAGGLRLDPYEISDDAARFIENAEGFFNQERLTEFVSGAANVNHSALLDWVHMTQRDRGLTDRVVDLRPLIDEIKHATPEKPWEQPWAIGYRRARELRRVLALSQSSRFRSFQQVARLFGASHDYNPAPRVDGIRALRSESEHGIRIHLRNHGNSAEAQAAHLFSIARAIGDAACFPEAELAPVNDLHRAFRQAAGRAFAAEFLAPIDEIRSMLSDRHDLMTIADEFSVSTTVIERQLENEGRIIQACT